MISKNIKIIYKERVTEFSSTRQEWDLSKFTIQIEGEEPIPLTELLTMLLANMRALGMIQRADQKK